MAIFIIAVWKLELEIQRYCQLFPSVCEVAFCFHHIVYVCQTPATVYFFCLEVFILRREIAHVKNYMEPPNTLETKTQSCLWV